MISIRKTLAAIATIGAIGAASIVMAGSAEAGSHHHGGHHHHHGGFGGGFFGGLAAGAIIGSAAYGPGYYEAEPVYEAPECFLTHKRVWNGYAWHWRRVRVCG